jgi:hypothetical protein
MDVRGEDYLVTAKNNSAVNHRSPSTVSDTSVDKAGRPCVEVESENTKTVAELKKHEAEQENCDSPEGDNVSEGYTRSYDGDGSNYIGELRTDDSDSDSDNDLGSKESENECERDNFIIAERLYQRSVQGGSRQRQRRLTRNLARRERPQRLSREFR